MCVCVCVCCCAAVYVCAILVHFVVVTLTSIPLHDVLYDVVVEGGLVLTHEIEQHGQLATQ